MPSIEILAVGQTTPIVAEFSFAYIADAVRKSHRRPAPRFQKEFDNYPGILYHLGNPNLKHAFEGRCYCAWSLLSAESKKVGRTFLEFAPEHHDSARELLRMLIDTSPSRHLLFTSDWQFGPGWTRYKQPVTLKQFWRLHDRRKVRLNALYPITGPGK
jgi:hypothetical protein